MQAQFDAAGTVVNASTLQTSAATYTAATDEVINGNLSLSYVKNKTTTFNFKSLYVTGNVTLTGNIVVNTTALHVGGTFTITGATTAGLTDQFGPIYAVSDTSWGGTTGEDHQLHELRRGARPHLDRRSVHAQRRRLQRRVR